MGGNKQIEIQVYFQLSLKDRIHNLFQPKEKRMVRNRTFKVDGYDDFELGSDGSLRVEFGNVAYIYPAHRIGRIKVSQ